MTAADRKKRRSLGLLLALVALGMFGFGYGLVPLYKVICEVTGINRLGDADQVANTQIDASRLVTVEFDTNSHEIPWGFRPLQTSVQVHPGQLAQALFEIRNDTDQAMSGQAIPSYGPAQAARYFKKVECFCFSRQDLAARETRQMPVVFVIDADLPKDVRTITLSYTFFEVGGSRKPDGARHAGSSTAGA